MVSILSNCWWIFRAGDACGKTDPDMSFGSASVFLRMDASWLVCPISSLFLCPTLPPLMIFSAIHLVRLGMIRRCGW